jgi:acetyl-CoA carboxylase biotin carboxyl carrier protein
VELTHEDVLEILGVLEGSDVDYLELEAGGTKIVADRNGVRAPATVSTAEEPQSRLARSAPEPIHPAAETRVTATTAAPTAAEPPPDGGDLHRITAPVVGVFYRSPEPGAPPFTEVGAEVTEDTTVGLVEVMKMFNSVTAGVRGRVVEILAENASFVEYGQTLMTIRPEPVE